MVIYGIWISVSVVIFFFWVIRGKGTHFQMELRRGQFDKSVGRQFATSLVWPMAVVAACSISICCAWVQVVEWVFGSSEELKDRGE